MSSQYSELVAACAAAREVLYVGRIMRELQLCDESEKGFLYIDNQACIQTARNGGGARSRHFAVRSCWLYEVLHLHQAIELRRIGTDDNPADLFTKNLIGRKTDFFGNFVLGSGSHSSYDDYCNTCGS